MRFEVRSSPKDNCLQPSFAIWTEGAEAVSAYAGRPVVHFTADPSDVAVGYASFDFADWFEYGDGPTDWTQSRTKMGPVFKSCDGKFISDHNNWDWCGEDPNDWYPMHVRFTCVVVAKGSEFSGWANYIENEK